MILALASLRLRLRDLQLSRCRRPGELNFNLPVAVTLKRLAADLRVFADFAMALKGVVVLQISDLLSFNRKCRGGFLGGQQSDVQCFMEKNRASVPCSFLEHFRRKAPSF